MPLIHLRTSQSNIENKDSLKEELINAIAKLTGKPSQYVMAIIEENLEMALGISTETSCFIEIKSIGSLNPKLISNSICNLIEERLKISSNKIYINFVDIKASDWGWNKKTFG